MKEYGDYSFIDQEKSFHDMISDEQKKITLINEEKKQLTIRLSTSMKKIKESAKQCSNIKILIEKIKDHQKKSEKVTN